MKRLLILIILLLVACGPVCNPPYILNGKDCCLDENSNQICDDDEPQPTLDFTELAEEQVEEPIEEPVEEVKELLPIDKVLQKVEDRVTSYTFITPYARYDGATFYIKGDLTRIDLHDAFTIKPGEYMDLIVFNRTAKTAKGYCRRMEHVCRDSISRVFDLDFKEYWEPSPIDLLKKFKGDKAEMVKEEGEIVDDRLATMFVFKEQTQTTTVWVDAHYGVPLRIREVQGKNDRVNSFENMAFNTIKDEVFEAFNVRPRKSG